VLSNLQQFAHVRHFRDPVTEQMARSVLSLGSLWSMEPKLGYTANDNRFFAFLAAKKFQIS